MLSAATVPRELVELTLNFSKGEGLIRTDIPSLSLARSDKKTEPVQAVYTPALCFIVQGEKQAVVNHQTYRYSPTQYLVTSVDLPVAGQITQASAQRPYLCLVLDLDASLVYDIVKEVGTDWSQDNESTHGIFVDHVNPDLTDAFLRLMRTSIHQRDQQVLAPLIIREITYRLLSSRYGAMIRQLGVAGSQMQRITKVIQRIRKEYALPLKVEDLARTANMSPSSFHHHFKQVTTMSPLQYQKQIRLQEARRLLSAELHDAASAGFQVGYESPSQFSREYTRMFGLPPKSDIKRLRAMA